MQFEVVTIFREAFDSFLATSLIGKAVAGGLVSVRFVDPREFTTDRHRSVDDAPYGGGEGMVIKPEPVVAALEWIDAQPREAAERAHRVLLSPQGRPLDQQALRRIRAGGHTVLVCGRYEGFDERIRCFVDEELSLGDFVLNGGEVAAMAIIEGVTRLVPGVLGNPQSLINESHAGGLLEHPQYTRPRVFRDHRVPDVLLEGNHEQIRRWRREQMLRRTRERRPDLWARFTPGAEDRALLGQAPDAKRGLAAHRTYVALLHHPVYDRAGRVVTTAITNLDLHDIARSARTFGLAGYFVVTPISAQQQLARRIVGHWQEGHGAHYNPLRGEALSLVDVLDDLEHAIARVEAREGQRPVTVATSAARRPGGVSCGELAMRISGEQPVLLLLGTGWGLAGEVLDTADFFLTPIEGGTGYNHLAVRSAAAILLDRLFGMREET